MKRLCPDVSSGKDSEVTLDAFQKGLVELLPRLRRFARALTGNAVDADDLVQAAVERGLERRDQWRTGTRLDSWMFTIMRNAWIDETRSRGRRGRLFAPPEAGENVAGSDAEAVHARLEAKEVAEAMGELPEDQRIAVALVLVEGLSYREAAEVLDIPMGTLTSRLVRGRQALLARFAGGGVAA
jgi:RNA polymerase sigma-70 factor (ECF subfamily)